MKTKSVSASPVRLNYSHPINRYSLSLVTILQVAALTCLLLLPIHQVGAVHVPDENGDPVWIVLPGEASETTPDTSDADANGTPDWLDVFNLAAATGAITYWSGGTWYIDGISTSFGGQWHATSADSDQDGIPDVLDNYPLDASNNSFDWQGGAFKINKPQNFI